MPHPGRTRALWAALAALSLLAADAPPGDRARARADAIRDLDAFIAHEVEAKNIPALSIAVVDGSEVAWSRGFGFADQDRKVPASADTVYRVGSPSEVFTDLAAMILADEGKLDIDAPVTAYLPDFAPRNMKGTPITLRQLMAHRSGLPREAPVGGYFDPIGPGLVDMVRSLERSEVLDPPQVFAKHSHAGVAVVGRVVERVAGEPFAEAVRRRVLEPLGMTRSRFAPDPALDPDRAAGLVATGYGRTFAAPTFRPGESPALGMDSTVTDLARFLVALLDDANVPRAGLPRPATLATMLTPQLSPLESSLGIGYGLGFRIDRPGGVRRISQSGGIQGFTAGLAAWPEAKLGVVILASHDRAHGVTGRIAEATLARFLAAREGRTLPPIELTTPLPPGLARSLAGRWKSLGTDDPIDFRADGSRLRMLSSEGGLTTELRALGADLVGDDVASYGSRFVREGDTLRRNRLGAFRRQPSAPQPPPPAPDAFRGLIGEYGWDHGTLFILERNSRLNALIDWSEMVPLFRRDDDTYTVPFYRTYAGETLRFRRVAQGRAESATLGGVEFPRRAIDGEGGKTFRIRPTRPVADILRDIDARGDRPPAEPGEFRAPDLVDLCTVSPTIRFDIRYATDNNFLGTPVYPSARAFFQRPAAEALGRVHAALKARGYGLLIHDSYRPWRITKVFWDATSGNDRNFVADPGKGSKHNRGCAVDLSMYDLATGQPVEMVGGYDEFSDRSYPNYPGGTTRQRWLRDLLRDAMEAEGFTVNGNEWWHFDYRDWRSYPILDLSFEALDARPAVPAP